MRFDYDSYRKMIRLLIKNEYKIKNYQNYLEHSEKIAILRHDVDTSLEYAVKLSEIEKEENVQATYFILLSTDFYNVASKNSQRYLHEIRTNGGEIGLHFDEARYDIQSQEDIVKYIREELSILSEICHEEIKVVSMHRPSDLVLGKDIDLGEGIINSYSNEFFQNFKYVSDSRRNWREDVEAIATSRKYEKLHILTHPFWYREEEKSAREVLLEFIDARGKQCYESLRENIRDLDEFVTREDVYGT